VSAIDLAIGPELPAALGRARPIHLTKDPALVEPLRDGRDLHVLTAADRRDRPDR